MSIQVDPTTASTEHQHRMRAYHEPKRRMVRYECGCGYYEKATYPRGSSRDKLLAETAAYMKERGWADGGTINRGTFPDYPDELLDPENFTADGTPKFTPDTDLMATAG